MAHRGGGKELSLENGKDDEENGVTPSGELMKFVGDGIADQSRERAPAQGLINIVNKAADGEGKVGKSQSIGIQNNYYHGVPRNKNRGDVLQGQVDDGSVCLTGYHGHRPVNLKASFRCGKIYTLLTSFEESIAQSLYKSIWKCEANGRSFLTYVWTNGAQSLLWFKDQIFQAFGARLVQVENRCLVFVFYHDTREDALHMKAENMSVLSLIKNLLEGADVDASSITIEILIVKLRDASVVTDDECLTDNKSDTSEYDENLLSAGYDPLAPSSENISLTSAIEEETDSTISGTIYRDDYIAGSKHKCCKTVDPSSLMPSFCNAFSDDRSVWVTWT